MTIDISSSLTSALAYLNMGLSVFPLAPGEKKPPKQFKWEAFQHTLPKLEHVKSWFEGTASNIAIATGMISRLLVFDIDGAVAKSHADDVVQNRIRRDTRDAVANSLWVETGGGGLHLWIRYKRDEFVEDDAAAREIKSRVLWRGADGHNEIRLKGLSKFNYG